MLNHTARRLAALGFAACASAALVGCGSDDSEAPETSTTTQSSEQHAEAKAHVHDGVVRAKGDDSDMTAIFGEIHNESDKDITVTGFEAGLEGATFEIHEIVDGEMRPKEGGLTIPAGETVSLEPGGDHFMVLDYPDPIEAGTTIPVSITLSDGQSIDLGEFEVRDMPAGGEEYDHGSHEHGEGHDHGHEGHDHDHAGHEHGGEGH
ncbi:copper chaperone PCu(A)C [Corynebacterium otitidis]|uniref:Secreted protein n=1 Tax=Corynebacterium otitidis ATCC 51513 TaxID=883169 RepID=K0YHV7_9CORY|nr:copper chaperone PCu(A)C [Corynebacterium otitidis]EJZ83026.1 hypothetical protein HMPREF9719_00021 [Corynebacterium otitidis ATCC 51513]KKO83672.1 hypothetical protein AAV33_05300 [Corynebacterium otitidis]